MSRLHLISLLCVLVASALCARWSVTVSSEPADVNSSDSPALQSEFSISGLSLGMTREEVEAIYGPGRTDGEGAGYGKRWKLISGTELDTLGVGYDRHGRVQYLCGRVLHYRGRQVNFVESGEWENYRTELEGFGETNDVLLGSDSRDRSPIYQYRDLGVDVQKFKEGIWYTVHPVWVLE